MKITALGKIIIAGIVLCIGFLIGCLIFNYFYIKNHAVSFFDGSDWISIIIGDITAISTLVLGYVSCWQNQQQREDNKREQRRMQARYEQEKEGIINQNRLDVLRKNLNDYRNKLYNIDLMMLEKDLACELSEFTPILRELPSCKTITKKTQDELWEFNRRVDKAIVFINFIQTTILYTKYYINELDDCVLSIIKLRHQYERVSSYYISNLLSSTIKTSDLNKKGFSKAIVDLMGCILDFQSYFKIYYSEALGQFERIEYKNNLEEFFLWFEESNKNVGILKEKISKEEKQFLEEKQSQKNSKN